MVGFGSEASSAAGRTSLMPALVGILLAVLFWMAAENFREGLPGIELQIDAAARAARRADDGGEARRLQASKDLARAERASLSAQLRTDDNPQMIRAKVVYDLRRKCEAAGVTTCSVRLADDTIAARPASAPGAGRSGSRSTGRQDDKTALIDLGVQKARAIVSGTFQKDEIVELSRRLNADPEVLWRINGIVVRGPQFEFDVERHMITPASSTSGTVGP